MSASKSLILVRLPSGFAWRRVSASRARRLIEKHKAFLSSTDPVELMLVGEPHRDREVTPHGLVSNNASIRVGRALLEKYVDGFEFADSAVKGWNSSLPVTPIPCDARQQTSSPSITFFSHDGEHRGRCKEKAQQFDKRL